jgi:hypothetical protein
MDELNCAPLAAELRYSRGRPTCISSARVTNFAHAACILCTFSGGMMLLLCSE